MSKDSAPHDPVAEGIEVQLQRSRTFLAEAETSQDSLDRFARLAACIYFARSAIEMMGTAASRSSTEETQIKQWLTKQWLRGWLIQRLRFHDFHRTPILDHSGGDYFRGPIELTAKPDEHGKRSIQFRLTEKGPVVSGKTDAKRLDQALHFSGINVFDDTTGQWISIMDAAREYLDAAPHMIEQFNKRAWEHAD